MLITRASFIANPFTYCPKCHQQTFGLLVLGNSDNAYTKECNICGYKEDFPLPKIKKHIIYLDQFVFDGIVKSLDKNHPKHDKVLNENPYWLELFKKLDIAHKAQLIVCPDSFFHQEESSYSNYFSSLKTIYEHFSDGITFSQYDEICRDQICEHFKNYLEGKSEMEPLTKPEDIVFGNELHRWNPPLRISVGYTMPDYMIAEAKADKKAGYIDFLSICQRWKKENNRTIDDWYREEVTGYAKSIYQGIIDKQKRLIDIGNGITEMTLDDAFPTFGEQLLRGMLSVAINYGMNDNGEVYNCIKTYLFSDQLDHIPAVRIKALLFAGLASLEAQGRKKPVTEGVFTDVNMVSSLLPYCDAIFLDKENQSILEHGHILPLLRVKTKIFSLRNKDDFLTYLDNLILGISPSHRKFLENYYGEKWDMPYISILNKDKGK